MSTPKGGTHRKRKVKDVDEDYVPDEVKTGPKKTKMVNAKDSPVRRSNAPYNPRHHDPTVAILGVPVEGTIRHFILSQVALSTRIITWLHVCHHFSHF